jgi:hypothetical protein
VRDRGALKYFVEIILKLKFLIYRTYSDRYNTVIFFFFLNFKIVYSQGGLKLQARTLATLPHSLVGHSMTYDVPKILKPIRHLK